MRYLFLYIDPSTGSMLFAVIIGMVSAVYFGVRTLIMRIKLGLGVNINELKKSKKINYVIFSDHKRYWNVFEPICDEFERRGIEVYYWTMSDDDPAFNKEYKYVKCEFIGTGNKAFAKLNFMNAKVCLSTTPGLDVYQWKRSAEVEKYVHVFHNPGVNTGGYKMFSLDYYDVVLAVSEEQTLGFKELEIKRNLKKKEYYIVGSTYLDALLMKSKKLPKTINSVPVVLIAPSWGENCMFEKYKFTIIEKLKLLNCKIVVRPHPQMYTANAKIMKEFEQKYNQDSSVEINKDNDNISILNQADLLITDFSGIIFDFVLIFHKPAMYMNVNRDLSTYEAFWLDDKDANAKAMSIVGMEINDSNIDKINELVDNILKNGSQITDLSQANRFWEEKLKAAENIVDYLIGCINKE